MHWIQSSRSIAPSSALFCWESSLWYCFPKRGIKAGLSDHSSSFYKVFVIFLAKHLTKPALIIKLISWKTGKRSINDINFSSRPSAREVSLIKDIYQGWLCSHTSSVRQDINWAAGAPVHNEPFIVQAAAFKEKFQVTNFKNLYHY